MSDRTGERRPGCDKVLLVQAELDGELDAAQAAALAGASRRLPDLPGGAAELLRTRALLRGELYEPMPDAVRARVMARLQRQATPAPTRRAAPCPALALAWLRWPASASASARPAPQRSPC